MPDANALGPSRCEATGIYNAESVMYPHNHLCCLGIALDAFKSWSRGREVVCNAQLLCVIMGVTNLFKDFILIITLVLSVHVIRTQLPPSPQVGHSFVKWLPCGRGLVWYDTPNITFNSKKYSTTTEEIKKYFRWIITARYEVLCIDWLAESRLL